MFDAPEAAAAARALAHDVGKYLTRTARNVVPVPAAPIRVLLPLLVRDLYEFDGMRMASVVFEDRLHALPTLASDACIAVCRRSFDEINRLEMAVRSGDVEAIQSACQHALRIEDVLLQLAQALSQGEEA